MYRFPASPPPHSTVALFPVNLGKGLASQMSSKAEHAQRWEPQHFQLLPELCLSVLEWEGIYTDAEILVEV
jgi:hypothetical protein